MDETLSKAILQAIQQRLGDRKLICGLCGGTRWQSGEIVNLPVQDNIGGGLVINSRILPLVPITCEVCGYTNFHNIIKLLGKEKFNEIIIRQQEASKAIHEAEEILKQEDNKGG